MIWLAGILAALLLAVLAIAVARLVFALPRPEERIDRPAIPPAPAGPLAGRAVQDREGLTGIAALRDGADAFAARILLADAAVSSIDAQYYIWLGDLTGTMLLDALLRAADRGVAVRLLLDDNGTAGLDPELAQLAAHRNAEVRLYNAFNLRRFKKASYAFDFFRLNRRMHNKSFTVDGRATIVGGRNVGDAYFGTGSASLYIDLDVLAVGRIVPQVVEDFDRYWASRSAHEAAAILPAAQGDPLGDRLRRWQADPAHGDYAEVLSRCGIVADLAADDLPLEWSDVRLLSDDPAKGQGAVPDESLLAGRLAEALGPVRERFDGVSPYFVPGGRGIASFERLRRDGVAVRMLTNSLAATDVLPVHAGYAKRRRALLDMGVELYELRRQVGAGVPKDVGVFGSSGASLHAKTFAVDGHRVFVGSFNFDPRSIRLNTEMGLLIDNEELALTLHGAFDDGLGGLAWRVETTRDGLRWVDPESGAARADEPGSGVLRSVALTVINRLPVEWLL